MRKKRIYLVNVLRLFFFALILSAAPLGAQEVPELPSLQFDEDINLDELSLPGEEDVGDLPLPSEGDEEKSQELNLDELEEPSNPSLTEVPLAPFEPAPEPEPEPEIADEAPDQEIQEILKGLSDEQMLEDQKEEEAKPAEVEFIESSPKRKWWEEGGEYQDQVLPEVIYKKEYEQRNKHLPKAYFLSDLERWLFDTAADGDVNGARALLNKGVDPDPRNVYGNTPLITAALHCQTDTVRLLLARDANPNAQNKLGLTALHIAAYKGCADIVRALLHMGADPNLKNKQGFTPLEFAATGRHHGVAKALLDGGAKRSSRFFSGMVQDESMLDAVKHGKGSKKKLPGELPGDAAGQDESEDADILEEALGLGADGDQAGEDKNKMDGSKDGEGEAGKKQVQDDGRWQQTKGGIWIKIGGAEPPQGMGGIYWRKDGNSWYPLDPNVAEDVKKISDLKKRLGDQTRQQETSPALPDEVLQDLKQMFAPVDGTPTQGLGGVWWHKVTGEWQPLDPNIPEERKEIDRLKGEAEMKAKKEAAEKAKREAEMKAKKEAEEKAKREAEMRTKKEADEKAKREAEMRAKKEAAEKAKREADMKAKKEAAEKAKREAEEKAKREAEMRAKKEAAEKAKREAEMKAKKEAEESAKREADMKAKKEAAEKAKREDEMRAKKEADEKAKRAEQLNQERLLMDMMKKHSDETGIITPFKEEPAVKSKMPEPLEPPSELEIKDSIIPEVDNSDIPIVPKRETQEKPPLQLQQLDDDLSDLAPLPEVPPEPLPFLPDDGPKLELPPIDEEESSVGGEVDEFDLWENLEDLPDFPSTATE